MASKKNRKDSIAQRSGTGPAAFTNWYGAMHGERWPALCQACAAPNRHFALSAGLLKPYFLDPASVLAALCLDIEPGQAVLDLCAAPGGKTLVIAQRLFGLVPREARLAELGRFTNADDQPGVAVSTAVEPLPDDGHWEGGPPSSALSPQGSRLVANERSATRRGRLRQVLAQHLPADLQSAMRTSGFDATAWGQYERDAYDRILLDAPCSSERHLIQDPAYLAEWSLKRSQQLAQQAYAMGLSAGQALKTGGRLLYCTCALSDLENDGTVARIIERSTTQAGRYGYRLEALTGEGRPDCLPSGLREDLAGIAEATTFGLRVWPDRSNGLGPLYFALLQKVGT